MSGGDDDQLAVVIPLHGRRDADLLARLREALADRGAVNEDLAGGDVLPKTWRLTARRAARDLQRPVRTGQVEHNDATVTVWAESSPTGRAPPTSRRLTPSRWAASPTPSPGSSRYGPWTEPPELSGPAAMVRAWTTTAGGAPTSAR